MRAHSNLVGQKFGRLTVESLERIKGVLCWRCSCDCGGTVTLRTARLTGSRPTKSCGCLWLETVPGSNRTHQRTGDYLHRIWGLIVHRCCNPKSPAYGNYGGRGITICNRWRYSFEAFVADVGERPTDAHTLDRINNDGNYEPGNVRWATRTEQARNTRFNRRITVNGVTKVLQEWANETGISRRTIAARLRRGWSPEKAVSKHV